MGRRIHAIEAGRSSSHAAVDWHQGDGAAAAAKGGVSIMLRGMWTWRHATFGTQKKGRKRAEKSKRGSERRSFCLFSVCQMSPRKVEKSGGSLSRLISCSSKRGARSRSTEARRRRASRTSATNVQTLPLCKIGNYLSISEVLEVFVCDLKPAHLNLGELSKETYYRSKATHNSVEPAHLNLGELCSVPWMPPRAPYGLLWRRQPTRISTWASSARCCAS